MRFGFFSNSQKSSQRVFPIQLLTAPKLFFSNKKKSHIFLLYFQENKTIFSNRWFDEEAAFSSFSFTKYFSVFVGVSSEPVVEKNLAGNLFNNNDFNQLLSVYCTFGNNFAGKFWYVLLWIDYMTCITLRWL